METSIMTTIREEIKSIQWIFKQWDKGDSAEEIVRMMLLHREAIDSIKTENFGWISVNDCLSKPVQTVSDAKKVTISISNDELNKMEDFLVCKLPKDEEEEYRKICVKIWERLVKQWDEKNNL